MTIPTPLPPEKLETPKIITGASEPFNFDPRHIGPVLWVSFILIIAITLTAGFIAVETNGSATFSFAILGLSLIGAWSVVLAYLGKNSDSGWFKTFSRKKDKE